MVDNARVILWGSEIGAVSWLGDRQIGVFQYSPEFLQSGIEVSPLMMPLGGMPYEFPALPPATFLGLPGLLADSLPDKFGNAVIDAWLASEGRDRKAFHPVERLCYMGSRGMGALEFKPAIPLSPTARQELEIANLVALANKVLARRSELAVMLSGEDDRDALNDILRVGTSAGGARAKAVLAWNSATGEFRSGQIPAGKGFEHWILKFDGMAGSGDLEIDSPRGYGRIEFAHYLMAVEAGITMAKCRLHHEGGRSHFMTRRFDRTDGGEKLHMQSLGAMAHCDYRQPGGYSYEQSLQILRRLELPREDMEQMVLRASFNVVCRNCDDHVKNISFLMDRRGDWRLAPAYDISYAWNPEGLWTSQHQMSVGGKRKGFIRDDLIALAHRAGIKKRPAGEMIDRVVKAVGRWPAYAEEAGVPGTQVRKLRKLQRTAL